MDFNPYKRPDYKTLSDVELDAAEKGARRNEMIAFGAGALGIVIGSGALGVLMLPVVLPAITVYVGHFIVAGALLSSMRFNSLGRACRTEKYNRNMTPANLQRINSPTAQPAPAPLPTPAPAQAPAFNGAAATVLGDDLEINKPLQFKKKAPGATA